MPAISVIIPVYNAAQYLPKCLDSVLAQTYKDIEIICVNDGSSDNSAQILAEYAAKDARIKCISQENGGQSKARNVALTLASGKWVYFVDADDYIHPQTLEILQTVALKTKCPVVTFTQTKKYCDDVIDLQNLSYNISNQPLKQLLSNIASSSVVWNKLYLAKLIKNRLFIEGIYFEDWPWITCLFADIKTAATIPYGLYAYNTENTSTMRSQWTVRKINDFVTGIRFVARHLQQTPVWPLVRNKRIAASLKMMINMTYREKSANSDDYLINILKQLHNEKIFRFRDLPFKVLCRYLKICWRLN